ncbi:DUF397 domain-containing protein [Gandjariella thermophila]|nr:DUF397 domain-containing protein [Gandjariella thermophila]
MPAPAVEGARWRKSTRSGGGGAQCVEIANLPARTAVRDSKRPDGPALLFRAATWSAFLDGVKAGALDL